MIDLRKATLQGHKNVVILKNFKKKKIKQKDTDSSMKIPPKIHQTKDDSLSSSHDSISQDSKRGKLILEIFIEPKDLRKRLAKIRSQLGVCNSQKAFRNYVPNTEAISTLKIKLKELSQRYTKVRQPSRN